jgi:hypothetical protein
MRRPLALLLLAVTLVFAACGDDDDGSSVSAYCDQLKESADEATAPTTTATGPSTSINYSNVLDKFNEALEKISSKAPAELEDDYGVVQDYFELYLKGLARDPSADNTKLQELGPKYKTAQENIAKYNKDTCKFEVTTTAPAVSRATTATTATPG